MKLDPEARRQLAETRATLLEHLRKDPDDLFALVIADVVGEIEPDPSLAPHRVHFRAIRGTDWRARAHDRGVDRMLFRLAYGWADTGIGAAAVAVLEARAVEISEARPRGVPAGLIDASYVPEALANDPRLVIAYHPSGHLKRIALDIDSLHNGELTLDERPGSGHFTIVAKRGGYGTMVQERYRNGVIHSTLNTPWHDGEDSSEAGPWTKWVMANLDELASLTTVVAPKKKVSKRRSARRQSRA